MRQLSKFSLNEINQVLRDIYSKLRSTRSGIRHERVVLDSNAIHYYLRKRTEYIINVTGVNFRIVDSNNLLVSKTPYRFERREQGYKCMTHLEVPPVLINGFGDEIRAVEHDGYYEFVGDVVLKSDIYLYPFRSELTIIYSS